jgi:hypothetical protein
MVYGLNRSFSMNVSTGSTQAPVDQKAQSEAYKRLHGGWLIFGRIIWLVIVVPTYALFVADIPAYFGSLRLLRAPNLQTFSVQLTPGDFQTLQSMGLSVDFYAMCMVVVSLLFQFSYALVGLLIFWRRSEYSIALLTSFALMMLPFGFAYITLQALPSTWSWSIPFLNSLGSASLILCGYLFPDGRFVPGWIRWLALVMLGYWIAVALVPSWELGRSLPSLVLFCGFGIGAVLVQVYRYRHVSTPRQRQQTKWLVFGMSIAVAGNIGARLLYYFVLLPLLPGSALAGALEITLIMFALLVIPVTLGIAIFSSHLWELDVLINRTLVYGTLTVSLALVYAGLVIGLQVLLHGLLIQQSNGIALVASTLAIAALFQPLRKRIQAIIDRRFYRRKYDAAKTVAAFSSTLRQEVELEQLREELLAVVQETMQPTFVSLWLRPTAPDRKQQTTWRSTPPASESGEQS